MVARTRSRSRPRSVKKSDSAASSSSQRAASPAKRSRSRSRPSSSSARKAAGSRRGSRAGLESSSANAAAAAAAATAAAAGAAEAGPGVREAEVTASVHSSASHADRVAASHTHGYLTAKGLLTLKEYKYVSGFTGVLDKYLMIPMWNWCLQFVPIWMASVHTAPNLLTIWSLCCGVASYFLFQYHSPDFNTFPPSWVFFTTSFLMWFYLILDGLDGKQARRTGSSGPLGQLFDHGCDAICCFTCGIFMVGVLQLGGHRAGLIVLLCHILPFWTSNWEEYCTGVMRFGVIGITEGQYLIIVLLFITGLMGSDKWNVPLSWLPMEFLREHAPAALKPSFSEPMETKFIAVFLGLVGVLYQVTSSCISVWQYHSLHAEERRVEQRYTKAKRIFVHHLCFLSVGAAWVWAPSTFFEEHTRIILLTISMLFGYQVTRLIISRVTRDPYPFFSLNVLMLPYVALVANCWTGERAFATYPVAIGYLCVLLAVYLHFVVVTVNQICDFLHIRCFKIVPKLESAVAK